MDSFQLQRVRRWAEDSFGTVKCHEVVQRITQNPKFGLYGILFILVAIWLSVRAIRFVQRPQFSRPSTLDLEKLASRQNGFKAPERQPGGAL
jgi:hypothetical protein